jgi:hypothetical protein
MNSQHATQYLIGINWQETLKSLVTNDKIIKSPLNTIQYQVFPYFWINYEQQTPTRIYPVFNRTL